jgi:two-component system phosphate regulon sensor histidine kinase PhoR
MKPRTQVFFLSLAIAGISSGILYYFEEGAYRLILFGLLILSLCFFLFNYYIERIIYHKIKLVYKLIYNLKRDNDLKAAIGEYITDDPITDVEEQVKGWAIDKKKEIDQLKLMARYRKEFLANLSHEFKTPLFSMQGFIQTLLEDDLEDKNQTRLFLTKADKNIERLVALVRDLDEIARLESGQIQLNIVSFDVLQLVADVIEMSEAKATELHIKLSVRQEGNFKTFVDADKEKINQVFSNLIDNALKYGKHGGEVRIMLYDMGDKILLEVTDNGIGIAEQHLPRLFERFYRTDASRARSIGGSGLGLAIVKHILEAHNETIHVRSTEGIGTTFALTLQKTRKKPLTIT